MSDLDKILAEWNAIKKDYEAGFRGTDADEISLLISYLDRMDAVITLVTKPREQKGEENLPGSPGAVDSTPCNSRGSLGKVKK